MSEFIFLLFSPFTESWLKKRWKSIRDEHRKIILYNHIHGNKVPPHRLAKCLSFLKIDLNGANEMNFEDFNRPKKESFCITQEMLDDCDISESVTHESISIPKLNKIETVAKIHKIPRQSETQDADRNLDAKSSIEAQTERKNAPAVSENKELNGTSQNKYETESSSLDTNKRCEDTIFGELVAAMLKKMNPDEKKRAKKEIMNILL